LYGLRGRSVKDDILSDLRESVSDCDNDTAWRVSEFDGTGRFAIESDLSGDMWRGRADIGEVEVCCSSGSSREPSGTSTESWIESTGVISPESVRRAYSSPKTFVLCVFPDASEAGRDD
jgi:hypothetical protein